MTIHDIDIDAAPESTTSSSGAPNRYRAQEGQVDRISLIFFYLNEGGDADLARPRMLAGMVHYHTAVGTVLSRQGDAGADEELWSSFEPARKKFASVVLRYPTDQRGKATKDGELQFLPWDFGEPTFRRLHAIAAKQKTLGQNLSHVDLFVSCTNTRRQFVELAVAGPAAWRAVPEKQAGWVARAVHVYDQIQIGRDVPDHELREKLGLAPQQGNSSGMDEADVEAFLDM